MAQLLACGLDDDAVARRVAKGWLHRRHAGVYAVGHAGRTLHATFMEAVLAGGDRAVLSHWAALVLWGLVRWDGRPVDVAVPGSGGRSRKGIRFRRLSLDSRDVDRQYGIPVTTAARALLDVAPQLSDERLRRVVRKAQAERIASVGQIADVLSRAKGLPTRRLAALVAEGHTPTYSGHEDAVLDVILRAGIERPQINQPLVAGTSTYYPDMRWPAARLILEIDSSWHDGRLAQDDDAARQADLEAIGERVLRTRREQAIARPEQLVRRLIAAGAPVGAHPG